MFKNKASIYVYLTILVIIVAGVYSALYYKPINNLLTDNSSTNEEVQGAQAEVEPTDEPNVDLEGGNNTVEPSLDKIVDSKTFVFIDTNGDSKKGSDEAFCEYCIARELICSDGKLGTIDKSTGLIMTAIAAKGLIVNEKMKSGDICWGAFDDRKIFIPNAKIDYSSISGDIEIPARYINTLLAGSNADIFAISEQDKGEYTYTFGSILPALKSLYEAKKDIWVRFTPDVTKVDLYYLKNTQILFDESGAVTGIKHGYYLKIKWNFSETFLNIKDELAYDFIM